MRDADDDFSDRLRTLLAELELSQAELARRTGIGRSTLNKIVNGKQRANAKQIGALAYELEVDLLELVGVADTLDEREALARELDEAKERAARADEAHQLERAELEASHAVKVAELEDALAVATAACEAEAHARSQAEADAATTIAQLEASLAEAVEAHEGKAAGLEAELEQLRSSHAALEQERDELRLKLDIRERFGDDPREKTQAPFEPGWSAAEVVELPDRYAPARAKADTVRMIIKGVGDLGSWLGSCITFNREVRRIDEQFGR